MVRYTDLLTVSLVTIIVVVAVAVIVVVVVVVDDVAVSIMITYCQSCISVFPSFILS